MAKTIMLQALFGRLAHITTTGSLIWRTVMTVFVDIWWKAISRSNRGTYPFPECLTFFSW